MVLSELSQMSLSSSSWDSSESRVKSTVAEWRLLFHCQLHVLANDVFQDLPGRWCLLTCVMSGRFQELLNRLLLEWRAARQAGENVFLAWWARKTLCSPRRKDCGYLYDADKDLNVLAIFSLFALGRKGVADFPLLAYAQTESEQTRHFYGLFARLQHCLFDDGRMKIESSILSSPGKELTGYSTVAAEQFYGWSMCSRNYKKKKGTTVFEGGGGMGRACVWECAKLTSRE